MGTSWADYLLPVGILAVVGLSLVKRVPVFDSFVQGAAQALGVIKGIFPYLAAVFVCIVLLQQSGIQDALARYLSPVLDALGVPAPLVGLVLVKPLSGSGSMAVLEDVLTQYGPDTYVGRCASVIAGSGETVLYVAAVYLGTVREKRLGYGVPVALVCTLAGAVAACWLCRVL